ncbi:LysR family transcriptional regulator [Bacillus sp. Marseille-P3800]|uniref:LysR family transcriptional regulator n=1 Tax=Bacillus sp. Marseille-P3800 TaxID=2014782 RepID=UPI000C06E8F2|nr:LysR family transcriptional regulator [Bacillus sp. Marseille-P3800]
MKMDAYYLFYITAIEQNFSKAAKRLFVTQPNISQSIAQLEDRLQTKLFQRHSKGVSLTNEGQLLFQQLEPAFQLIQQAETNLNERRYLKQGSVAIGASDSTCKHLLLPIVQSFQRQFPEIQLKLQHGSTPQLIEKLDQGTIDLALVHMPINEQTYTIHSVFTIHSTFVVGERYQSLAREPQSIADLAHYPILSFSQKSHARHYLNELFAKQDLLVTPEVEVGAMDVLLECARIGMGVAFVTKEFVQQELDEHALYEVSLDEPLNPRQIGIVTRNQAQLSHAANRFLEKLNQSQ